MSEENSPLYAESDELGVLGACLIGGLDSAAEAMPLYRSGAIFNAELLEIFQVVAALEGEGVAPDMLAVARKWPAIHPKKPVPALTLSRAVEACPSASNLEFHATGVREAFRRRRIREIGIKLSGDSTNPSKPVEEAISEMEAGLISCDHSQSNIKGSKAVMLELIDDLQERSKRNGDISGISTGYRKLDRMTDGLQPGEMFLVAARPSIGKTALATSMVCSICIGAKVPTLFVTCEMSEASIARRIMASVASVSMGTLKRGNLNPNEYQRVFSANSKIGAAPLYYCNAVSGMTSAQVGAEIRRAVRKHGVKVVFVDYLQKVLPTKRHEKRTYEVAEVSSKLKAIADSCGVSVVALAQLNRESEKEKGRTPRLSDLADSGQIERDADTVCLLTRNREESRGEAQLLVAKQRDGECGSVGLWYEGPFCRFDDNPELKEVP